MHTTHASFLLAALLGSVGCSSASMNGTSGKQDGSDAVAETPTETEAKTETDTATDTDSGESAGTATAGTGSGNDPDFDPDRRKTNTSTITSTSTMTSTSTVTSTSTSTATSTSTSTSTGVDPDEPECDTAAAGDEVAEGLTRANMETIRHTLDLHTLLWDDGLVEFFPMVDTASDFEAWTKRAIEQGDGSEFTYTDGWCHRYGRFAVVNETFDLTFVSAGTDGTFDTADDIPVTWHGLDAPN